MTPEDMARLQGQSFARGWSAASFAEFRDDPATYLKCEPSGFALARAVLDEAELLTIVVGSEARGQGVGKRLLRGLMDDLRRAGVTRLLLEVAEDNHAAQALYLGTGSSRKVGGAAITRARAVPWMPC